MRMRAQVPLPVTTFQFAGLAPLLYGCHVLRDTQRHSNPIQNTPTTPTLHLLCSDHSQSPQSYYTNEIFSPFPPDSFHLVVSFIPDPIFNCI